MRQQGDYEFISLLNKIRVGAVDDEVEKLLRSTTGQFSANIWTAYFG